MKAKPSKPTRRQVPPQALQTPQVNLEGDALERATAAKLGVLAGLRGVQAVIAWDGAQYTANGTPCGRSVHGVYAWLDEQAKATP
jgi:hypothetical protein